MKHTTILAAALALSLATPALAEDMIAGDWTTAAGSTARISGSGSYTIKLVSGEHSGKTIGSMSGSNGKYTGTITDPKDGKTYNGSARISGTTMRMKGCVAKILCKTQVWKKQAG